MVYASCSVKKMFLMKINYLIALPTLTKFIKEPFSIIDCKLRDKEKWRTMKTQILDDWINFTIKEAAENVKKNIVYKKVIDTLLRFLWIRFAQQFVIHPYSSLPYWHKKERAQDRLKIFIYFSHGGFFRKLHLCPKAVNKIAENVWGKIHQKYFVFCVVFSEKRNIWSDLMMHLSDE